MTGRGRGIARGRGRGRGQTASANIVSMAEVVRHLILERLILK